MTKRYIIVLLVFIPAFSWAQFYVGFKAGYSPLSTVSFKPDLNATPFYGNKPDFGLIVKYFDQKWWGLQAEINFNQRGYNMPYKEIYKQRHVNDYVEMPIFTQLRINLAGVYIHTQGGLFVAYLLNAKQGDDESGEMILKPYNLDMLRDNRFDYGLVGGGGISKEFKWGIIQLDVRVLYGFGDLYNHEYKDMPDQSKAVVQSVSISYLYNISKIFKKQNQEISK